jgi:tripartite-type tricarboxylate transporter receptor subunit TctC
MSSAIGTGRRWMYWIAATACLCATASWAQNYPVKPVRYVVPFPAGTGNDIVGRLLADRLTRLWGQQVIVDNRAGASGAIGAAFVAKAPPDGYTCSIATSWRAQTNHPRRTYAPNSTALASIRRCAGAPISVQNSSISSAISPARRSPTNGSSVIAPAMSCCN